jgi:hypothetical protein
MSARSWWITASLISAFESSQGLLAALVLGELAQVVGPPGGVVADLGDRGHVDGAVELAVAPRVEPVADVGTAGCFDGRGGVVAGVSGWRLGTAEGPRSGR